jgi:predicted porin
MKSTLPASILAASAFFSVSAHADDAVSSLPEGIGFYGRLNISAQIDEDYDTHKAPAASEWDTNQSWHSNASRLGARGKYTLNDDWALVYKAEYEIDANNGYGSTDDFVLAREIYAGISSKTFGTLEGGKIDTPLKMLQSKVDLFPDLSAADIKNIMVGKNRDSYTYLYRTPSFHGLTAAFANVNFRESTSDYVHQDGNSMSVTYAADKLLSNSDGFYFAVAHDENIHDLDVDRVAAQYKFGSQEQCGVFTVGALGQLARQVIPQKTFVNGETSANGYMYNAAWGFTSADTVKVQYGKSQEIEYSGDVVSVGYDHMLNKNLRLYVYHSVINSMEEKDTSDRTLKSTGVGAEYNF